MNLQYTKKEVLTVLEDDLVDDTVHQPYAAFNQGFDAYLLKIPKCKNPYRFSWNGRWWTLGWEEAFDQSKILSKGKE